MALTDRLGGKEAWRRPQFSYVICTTRLFLHFPNELCYDYLRFEGNGKIPFESFFQFIYVGR